MTLDSIGTRSPRTDGPADLPGLAGLLELLRTLCRRPRRGESPGREVEGLPRRRHGLPLVCVVRPAGSPILRTLAGQLAAARPGQIPHAWLSCETSQRSVAPLPTAGEAVDRQSSVDGAFGREWSATGDVADLLSHLARTLGGTRNSRYGRIRFQRFGLAYWLLGQDVSGDEIDPDRLLRRRLRRRAIAQHRLGGGGDKVLAATSPTAPAWFSLLLLVVPPLWFMLRVGGRVPVLSQPYRWLLRQPYLAPRDPGTFVGFAERLTIAGRLQEDPEQVRKLLVNAFLEDLRSAYRRRPWRPRAARRTTYPVVFLDDATRDNGGYRLLKLVNDVRSETGSFDPLVLFSASQRVPPSAAPVGAPPTVAGGEPAWPAARAVEGYQAWCRQFAADSRSRTPTAWYLPVEVPAANSVRGGPPILSRPGFAVPRPPLWARRGVLALAVLIVAATGLGSAGWLYRAGTARVAAQNRAFASIHCGQSRTVGFAELLHTDGSTGLCYGISDGVVTFTRNEATHQAMAKIWAQNASVDPGRPAYTIVYLSSLDSTTPTNSMLELAGLALRQAVYNADPSSPAQLRILVANGGGAMEHGLEVAADIGTLMRRYSGIVGVVGMSQSRTPTLQTIKRLAGTGLPMVAATLSADSLVEQSPLYLQVSPQNRNEAAVAAAFVTGKLAPSLGLRPTVTLVQSNDADDVYSGNLAQDLTAAFHQAGGVTVGPPRYYAVSPEPVHPASASSVPAADLGPELCQDRGAVIFTGRPEDFRSFLGGIRDSCRGNPPAIVGGDDISRYVAEPQDRTRYGVPFHYLSFSVGQVSCDASLLYTKLRAVLPLLCRPGDFDPSLDGHLALAYDAASVLLHAVDALRREAVPVTPGHVWRQLSTITGATGRIEAETGVIDFNGGQFMSDKAVAVLGVDAAGHVAQEGTCGRTDAAPAPWCSPPAPG